MKQLTIDYRYNPPRYTVINARGVHRATARSIVSAALVADFFKHIGYEIVHVQQEKISMLSKSQITAQMANHRKYIQQVIQEENITGKGSFKIIEKFTRHGYIVPVGDGYQLTDAGRAYAEQIGVVANMTANTSSVTITAQVEQPAPQPEQEQPENDFTQRIAEMSQTILTMQRQLDEAEIEIDSYIAQIADMERTIDEMQCSAEESERILWALHYMINAISETITTLKSDHAKSVTMLVPMAALINRALTDANSEEIPF